MAAELAALHPGLPVSLLELLGRHFGLMLEWNRAHNLTRVVDPEQAASLHYLDSLLPLLDLPPPAVVADLGSGNGLPGLVAAALWPSAQVVLVESVAKKCSFLRAVRASLDLPQVTVAAVKVEALAPLGATLVLTRATFRWPEVPSMAARHLAPGGTLLAYLGREAPTAQQWSEAAGQAGLGEPALRPYLLPPAAAQRHCALARAAT